jgi:phosphoribosylanthranilate isomerase
LRKDFIIDEIQIYEAAAAGADAVLLIVAALDEVTLAKLRAVAEDELGLDALVEVHTSEELRCAINAGAKIIGVNNRDLRTFRTSLATSEQLIAEAPRDRIMISESGLRDPEAVRNLQELGFRGFLIGEALMRAPNPEAALRDFVGSGRFQPASTGISAGCMTPPQENCRASVSDAMSFHRNAPQPALQIQIKICGVTNVNDALGCSELGADMIGFNFYRKSSRYVEPARVRRIVDELPPGILAVGVFVDATAAEIREVAKTAGVRCVQLHGNATPESCGELAQEFRVIRALSTGERFDPQQAAEFPDCDVLIDAYHPELRGGTGQTCDWSAARGSMRYTRFLILSGGLNAQNVGNAIVAVMPHGIDVCSGVESGPGIKDHGALKQFVRAVRTVNFGTRNIHSQSVATMSS